MKTIGDLLSRDLEPAGSKRSSRSIRPMSSPVYSEIERVRRHGQHPGPVRPCCSRRSPKHRPIRNESIGVWVSGFFGSGKSSFAKNLGYALQEPQGHGRATSPTLFKRQTGRRAGLRTCSTSSTPRSRPRSFFFEVAKEQDTRRVTERIAELMYAVLLRELGLRRGLRHRRAWRSNWKPRGKLDDFIETLQETPQAGLDDGPQRVLSGSPVPVPSCTHLDPATYPSADSWSHSQRNRDTVNHRQQGRRTDLRACRAVAAPARRWSSSSTKWGSTSPAAATRSKTCVPPSRSSARSARIC